jgi:phosphate transport system substrate-binding protein
MALIAGMILCAGSGFAQEVTLKSSNGAVTMTGTLLDYDGEFYRLDTLFGEMTLHALGVTCQGLACPDPGQYAADITIVGAEEVLRHFLPAMIEEFVFSSGHFATRLDQGSWGWTYFISDAARVPVARIQANVTPSARAFTDFAEDRVDLVFATRMPTAAEVKAASEAELGTITAPQRHRVMLYDGLVFVVSPDNPIAALSRQQIQAIYSGKITNWSSLGGVNAPISVYARTPGSDIADLFEASFFPEGSETARVSAKVIHTDREMADSVARDPLAIGFTGFADIRNARPLMIRDTCGIRLSPTRFNLQAGDYPFSRRLFLFTPERRLPVFIRSFLAWAESDAAQRFITRQGFAGLDLDQLPLAMQQNRVANAVVEAGDDVPLTALKRFVRAFSDADRLSISFRFQDSSTQMDDRSRRNVDLLARMIETGEFDGHEIIFAGFSDAEGGATGNRKIARQRAEMVAKAVAKAAGRAETTRYKIRTLGMGEVSPIACNGDADGRRLNRRDEVWIK